MIWQDLMLDRWVEVDALRAAIASAFNIPVDAIAAVDAPEQLDETSPVALIVLERVRQHRDFPLQLLIALRDDTLAGKHDGFDGVLRVVRTLAERLNTTVLFADGPLAPSEWVRVGPTGQTDVVALDVDETGDVDSFFVVGARAFQDDRQTSRAEKSRLTA